MGERMSVTIFDVAARAGVSKSTVSRVLNDPGQAPAVTRERVLQACAELSYQPSSAARALRVGRSPMLALMVGDISQPYHGALAKGMERAARQRGYGVLLLDLDRSLRRLTEYLDRIAAKGVFGVVIATVNDIDTPELRHRLVKLRERGIAAVTAAQSLTYSDIPSVRVDHADTAFRATRHLYDRGCGDVALVVGDPTVPYAQPMVQGYLDALPGGSRADAETERVLAGSYEPERSTEAVARLLSTGARPDGFVAATLYSVLGVNAALEEHGLGGTARVVCCEDVPLLDYMRPNVDSFGIDYDDYAARIVAALESADSGAPTENVVVRSTLKRR